MAKTRARELGRFGSNVRKLREAKDWTQEQLAERANLDQTCLSRINPVEVRLPYENGATERWSAFTPTRSPAFAFTLSVLRSSRHRH